MKARASLDLNCKQIQGNKDLQCNTPVRLILADDEIEGVLVAYVADGHGYRHFWLIQHTYLGTFR
jgi:hypothetical protein